MSFLSSLCKTLGRLGKQKTLRSRFRADTGEARDETEFDEESVWALQNATDKKTGKKVTVFSLKQAGDKTQRLFAQNTVQMLRKIHHPDVLRPILYSDSDEDIFFVTEQVSPLPDALHSLSRDILLLAVRSLVNAVDFINGACNTVHANIRPSSVFITKAGSLKLGGFEVARGRDCFLSHESSMTFIKLVRALPKIAGYIPPELTPASTGRMCNWPHHAIDSWCVGTLLEKLPIADTGLHTSARKLKTRNTATRPNPQILLMEHGNVFNTPFIVFAETLKTHPQMTELEREHFYSKTTLSIRKGLLGIPPCYARHSVLQRLCERGQTPPTPGLVHFTAAVLGGDPAGEHEEHLPLLEDLLREFCAVRRSEVQRPLLGGLSAISALVSPGCIQGTVFPWLAECGVSPESEIRRGAADSLSDIVPQLETKTKNTELVKLFIQLLSDRDDGTRLSVLATIQNTHTQLSRQTHESYILPALLRTAEKSATKTALAALAVLEETTKNISVATIANTAIPQMAPLLAHRDGEVAARTQKTLVAILARLEVCDAAEKSTLSEPAQQTPAKDADWESDGWSDGTDGATCAVQKPDTPLFDSENPWLE
ncbi:MAG: SCY1 protein kinase [Amphiamblys sp. WSBS2006]|nr:MAG: SCY1 protein kinase [Amphiamblys sp. WSBS2006]